MNPHQKPQEDVVADLAAVDAILARWGSTPDNARPSIKLGLLRRLRAMLDTPTYEAGRRDMREGWVLVPREATLAMMQAGEKAAWDDHNHMPAIAAMSCAWDAMLAALPGAAADEAAAKYRHVKRGTVYEVVGKAELQMNCDLLVDGSEMVVYRGQDGKLWVREESEFHDGRFEAVPTEPLGGEG